MNTHIKELADRALKLCDDAKERGIEEYSARFAELLIKECAEVCFSRASIIIARNEKSDDRFLNGVKAMTYNIAGECINEHFGVT